MAEKPRSVIVFTHNGKTTVLTGWRAWFAGAAGVLVAWVALAVVAVLMLGLVVTVGLGMILLVPAAIIVALVASALRRAG